MLVQVVRVFVLARVTVKSLKSLPGLEGCQLPPDNALLNSNVYSTAETVLLAWITAHYHKALLLLLSLCFSSHLSDQTLWLCYVC